MKRFIFGIILVILSFFSFVLPENYKGMTSASILFFLFCWGIIRISESITLRFYGSSLTEKIKSSKRNIFLFILVSFIGGLILEGIVSFSGKLWIYPYFSITKYALFFIPGFALYWLVISESYLASKAVIDSLFKGKRQVSKPFIFENRLFNTLGIFGVVLFVIFIALFIIDFSKSQELFWSKSNLTSNAGNYILPFSYIILFFFSSWFTLESIEHYEKRSSLIKDVIHNYKSPLFSVLAGSFLLGFLMEMQNIPVKLWGYFNWPYQEITFLTLPVIMLLVWPLHYIFFLSLFRAITNKESSEIWKGDLIK